MVKKIASISISLCLLIVGLSSPLVRSYAADLTPTPTPISSSDSSCDAGCWQQKINELEGKISNLQGQEKTLSSQIQVMDSQIALTKLRIQSTQQQIMNLTMDIDTANTKISKLQGSIDNLTKVLMGRIVATYEIGSSQPFQLLVSSSDISDFFARANYLRIAQAHDKQLIYDTVQAKNDYTNQKQIYESEKEQVVALNTQLQAYNDQLDQEQAQKKQLLADTQGSEANYQQQLASAQAQLEALSNFARSRIGAGGSIIPHQDLSDSWGPYYNQRDANWGNNLIGYSDTQVWEVGCLLTSYAMVSSHYGSVVTPAQVAANPSNFWGSTADFNAPGPAPAGHSASYVADPSMSSLVSEIQAGNVVIAGMSANGGSRAQGYYSDHWVVLRGVDSNGNFMINDPWYSGAMNVSINDHYGSWKIIEARIYH